ncbi:hypothetical protein J7337_001300 [Fusarium musae]|uniref:Uncharacterized protein n=1 Tax=Fusarium musae TaxID=1042133 RepID=A0A9P8DT41_9HYPO|nr:hypothetical protein J7337_001300 [Fusarium musae]KAG9507745.1 hypothetical protein J7337_001300 [Fusarium musae]
MARLPWLPQIQVHILFLLPSNAVLISLIKMAHVDGEQSDCDPYSPSMEEFRVKIRKCQDASMARSRVQSVLSNYNQMCPDMPKAIQLKVARFLRHEKWVDSPRTLSKFKLYSLLTGQGRTKALNFSAWLVVAAIWPSHLLVLGIADEMSQLWGQKFPDTRPFFPKYASEEEALLKYEGNFVTGDDYPLSDVSDGHSKDHNKEDYKRKSNLGDIFERAAKKHKVDRTTASPNRNIPEPHNVQKTPGIEGPEQGKVSYLKRKIKARDELLSEKDKVIKQQDAQVKKLELQRDRRFKDGDKDFRRLFNRVKALKTSLKDAAEKEHDLQAYVRQLEDQIKSRDEEIEKLSDRNRKLSAKNQDGYRTWEMHAEGLEGGRGKEIKELIRDDRTLGEKVKEPSDTEEE